MSWGRWESNPDQQIKSLQPDLRATPPGMATVTGAPSDMGFIPSGRYENVCSWTLEMVLSLGARADRSENDRSPSRCDRGRCAICGYGRCALNLHFHHVDPERKRLELGSHTGASLTTLLAELEKCVLLCANCHGEVESGLVDSPDAGARYVGQQPATGPSSSW